jgi:Ca-activated chloride channel family protein
MTLRNTALSALISATLPFAGHATDICTEDAMIVFDGSGSMSEMGFNNLDEPRIFQARRAMRDSMPFIEQFRRIGLIIYGPGSGESCENIDLRFGPTANAAGMVINEVEQLVPDGMTALTESVRQAAETLNFRAKPAAVVLVTDGKETCGGTPCALADQLIAEAQDLTIHVIGFKVRADFFSWDNPEQTDDARIEATTVAECMSEKTGGKYVSAETVDELSAALEDTLGCQIIGSLQSRTRRSSRS